MRQIDATVIWSEDDDGPMVKPDPIVVPKGNGATVIRWSRGAGISALSIAGLDPAVFTPAASHGLVVSFTTTDANREPGTYDYTVSAVRSAGAPVAHDPKIQNGG